MKSYFLVANGQPNDRAVYYTAQESFHGGELWGNINDAYKFESKEELLLYLAKLDGFDLSRIIIVRIADVTMDKCIKGFDDCMHSIKSDERELFHKFNTVSYITNSRMED